MVKELLLGDNPFLGVSHLHQEKAKEESSEASLYNKVKVFEAAINGGATGFTFTAHRSNLELLEYLKLNRIDLLESLNYYILIPYAQFYFSEANVVGTPRLIKSVMFKMLRNYSTITDIIEALLLMKMEKLIGAFIITELSPYIKLLKKEKIKAVLLHEALTEVIIAFNSIDLLKFLDSYIRKKIGISFGVETRNLGQMHRLISMNNSYPEYLMTPFNPLGYQMAPTKEAVELSIRELGGKVKIITINNLASGAINLDEAILYLEKFREQIYAITSASTKPKRIHDNFNKLYKHFII